MRLLMLLVFLLTGNLLLAAERSFETVTPGYEMVFPQDFGAHPDFRIEWWYATGWLQTTEGQQLGFQITFFRIATNAEKSNPSRFAPGQLIIAHAALSDPALDSLLHDQRIRREGFDLVYARTGNTDVKLDDWLLKRETDGRYQTFVQATDFALELAFSPTQPLLLQGEQGFSRKGPKMEQASYYYSEPHLQVTGTITRNGKPIAVTGTAWLDHEWSSELLDPNAAGWDWVGANLDDGGALMAFQIRSKDGAKVWAHAVWRDANGRMTAFAPEDVHFQPQRRWRSPHTQAEYPVAMTIKTGETTWQLIPLMDDQELDSRASIGAVYWEGAVTLRRDNQPAGRGYLELTGYVQPLSTGGNDD
ncbi:lipocalin-like domain-containing protein [Nitrosomonas mobilis]|uniref:Putative AttH n=1 Tax=Nitrosomonas mobilis TaxID=51642 RepID=A0A1G5SHH8_9PROT|nr:carotenoid 1,2-hydratase [Nitrosomonas mobilis]SCZ86011.1 putative AttH [Nitrosomonas mobilis]HNO75340.1 carotenoid 1,2-hydratase [Nitrosomonas mobilis]